MAICVGAIATIKVFPDLNPLDYLFLEPPEHSARFYPDDTFLYSYANLYPRGSQRKHMEDLWERFNENRTFRQKLEDTRGRMGRKDWYQYRRRRQTLAGTLFLGQVSFDLMQTTFQSRQEQYQSETARLLKYSSIN